jgi:hypothetical protein
MVITDVPIEVLDRDVSQYCAQFGCVEAVRFPPLCTGSATSHCLVTFEDAADAAAAASALRHGATIAGFTVGRGFIV